VDGDQHLLGETAVNSPARFRCRWAQLLQATPTVLTRAVRPAGINQNVAGPLKVASDLVPKHPRQRPADGAINHLQVRVAHSRRKDPDNPLGARRLKTLPILEHKRLTRRMQNGCAHRA